MRRWFLSSARPEIVSRPPTASRMALLELLLWLSEHRIADPGVSVLFEAVRFVPIGQFALAGSTWALFRRKAKGPSVMIAIFGNGVHDLTADPLPLVLFWNFDHAKRCGKNFDRGTGHRRQDVSSENACAILRLTQRASLHLLRIEQKITCLYLAVHFCNFRRAALSMCFSRILRGPM